MAERDQSVFYRNLKSCEYPLLDQKQKKWRRSNTIVFDCTPPHPVRIYGDAFIKHYCTFFCVCIDLNVGKRQVHFHSAIRFSTFSLSFHSLCITVFFVNIPIFLKFYAVDAFSYCYCIVSRRRQRGKKHTHIHAYTLNKLIGSIAFITSSSLNLVFQFLLNVLQTRQFQFVFNKNYWVFFFWFWFQMRQLAAAR